jgi:hypothetical protein
MFHKTQKPTNSKYNTLKSDSLLALCLLQNGKGPQLQKSKVYYRMSEHFRTVSMKLSLKMNGGSLPLPLTEGKSNWNTFLYSLCATNIPTSDLNYPLFQ